jgi:dolichyl-phosphate-mannose-protein mannosyltransferase
MTTFNHSITSVGRKEWIALAVLIVVYSLVAFYNLGEASAPQTYTVIDSAENAVVFALDQQPETVVLYAPVNDSSKYIGITIMGSSDGVTWQRIFDTDDDANDYTAAMIWYRYTLQSTPSTRYIKIMKHAAANRLVLAETAFYNAQGEKIDAQPLTEGAARLLDEPDTLRTTYDRMTSAYFDESYFPASALEMQDGLAVAEMDHPPVGRLIIGIGMNLWGRNPFGFRFMQVIAGILMLPLLYFAGRSLFKSPRWAFLATAFLAVDFMHYTQTRIGTLDAFLVLFILGMYAFMVFYHYSRHQGWRRVFLLLSGICAGCAIGTKWSGLYACAGLAILFFYWLFKGMRRGDAILRKTLLKDCIWCLFCFVALPCGIYYLSYIPYARTLGNSDILQVIIQHSQTMLAYHTGNATNYHHPYSSEWWTWFVALKPVFYYYKAPPESVYLYATGNPLIWGFGLVGVLFALENGITRKDETGIFIALGYFSQLIPWFFVTRDTFLYHYFPMVPFLMLGVVYLFQNTCNTQLLRPWKERFIIAFAALAGAEFWIAFPFIYGSSMEWNTILTLRVVFLAAAGVMLILYFILFVLDAREQKPLFKKIKEPAP